jgi:hypothetical protein
MKGEKKNKKEKRLKKEIDMSFVIYVVYMRVNYLFILF